MVSRQSSDLRFGLSHPDGISSRPAVTRDFPQVGVFLEPVSFTLLGIYLVVTPGFGGAQHYALEHTES